MKIEKIGERIKLVRKIRNITQREVCRNLKMSPQALGFLEQGVTKQPRNIEALAKVLEVDPLWLLTGEGMGPADLPEEQALVSPFSYVRVPIFDYAYLIKGVTINSLQSDMEQRKIMENQIVFLPQESPEAESLFIVKDAHLDAMNFTSQHVPCIYPHEKLLFSTSKAPKHGSVVMANVKNQLLIRQYIEEAGEVYFKPSNPAYPTIQAAEEEFEVLGVLVSAHRNFNGNSRVIL